MDCPMVVHFKGGSLGGEVRVMNKHDFVGGRLRIPVYVPQSGQTVSYPRYNDGFGYPPVIQYECDEYQIDRTIRPDEFEARWIRPKDRSAEVVKLTDENKRLQTMLTEALDALEAVKKLKKFFKKQP